MCSTIQYSEWIYMGGTRSCGPIQFIFNTDWRMKIIFGNHIQSKYRSLNIKFGVNWASHVFKSPVFRLDLYGRYHILWTDIAHFQYQPAYVQQKPMCNFSSLQLFAFGRNRVYDRRTAIRTDSRHSSNVLEFCADQMSLRNIGSQIIISMCYKRIDKTNIPSMRRV